MPAHVIHASARSKMFWLVFGIVAVVNVAWWVTLQLLQDHDTVWNYWFNAVYAVPFLIAGMWIIVHASSWRNDGSADAHALTHLGLGIIAHGIAQLIWTYYNVVLGIDAPENSFADIFFTAAVLFQLYGAFVLLVHRTKAPTIKRFGYVFRLVYTSVAVIVGSALIVLVVFPTEEGFLFNINTFYTATSFLRAFLIMLNLYRERHDELRGFLFVQMIAATVFGAADAFYGVRSFTEVYWNGDIVDAFFASGALLLFLSVLFLPRQIQHEGAGRDDQQAWLKLESLFPVSVILLGLLIAGRTAETVHTSSLTQLRLETEQETLQIAALMNQTVLGEVKQLNGLVGLFEASVEVTAEEFLAYVSAVEDRSGHISENGFITPEGDLVYTTLPGLKGIDLRNDPLRAGLMDKAKSTSSFVASEPTYLLEGVPGVLLYEPVFKNGEFLGVVSASVHLEKFLDGITAVFSEEDFDVLITTETTIIDASGRSIYDLAGREIDETGIPGDHVMYEFPDESPAVVTQTIPVDGIDWRVRVSPTSVRAERVYADPTSAFLVISLTFAALAGLFFIIVSQQARLREQLMERTRSLREKITELQESKFFLDNVNEGVVAADQQGRVEYVNDSAARVLDIRSERILDHHFSYIFSELGEDFSEVQATVMEKRVWEREVRHMLTATQGRDVYISVSPLQEPEKGIVGYLLVARDITARKEMERQKNQFVSLVSHQLRTPMTQLSWMTETLMEKSKLSKAVRQQLSSMTDIINAENKLVGDLLNISRIERGVLKLETEDVPVKRLIANAVKPLEKMAQDRKITIRVTDTPAGLFVRVDAEKIAEALRNLVDNAIKYSPEHSAITIRAIPSDSRSLEVSIADQGSGIPEELWGKLFEIKTLPTTTGQSLSAGLGLYLTKKFVEAVGGAIRFDTSPAGTTFFVRLPRVPNRG